MCSYLTPSQLRPLSKAAVTDVSFHVCFFAVYQHDFSMTSNLFELAAQMRVPLLAILFEGMLSTDPKGDLTLIPLAEDDFFLRALAPQGDAEDPVFDSLWDAGLSEDDVEGGVIDLGSLVSDAPEPFKSLFDSFDQWFRASLNKVAREAVIEFGLMEVTDASIGVQIFPAETSGEYVWKITLGD